MELTQKTPSSCKIEHLLTYLTSQLTREDGKAIYWGISKL